jgi:hypothetical protein
MATTISINLDLTGDIRMRLQYTPSMTDPSIRDKTIYFLPTVAMSKALISKAQTGKTGIALYTDPAAFTKLVRYIRSSPDFQPLTRAEAKQEGVTYRNMKFYEETLFPRGSTLLIDTRAYKIRKSKIIATDTDSGDNYRLSLEVDVLKAASSGRIQMARRDCQDRAREIDDLTTELFGTSLGLWKGIPPAPKEVLPAMYTSGRTGIASAARGERPRRLYNPYAPIGPFGPTIPAARAYAPPVARPAYQTSDRMDRSLPSVQDRSRPLSARSAPADDRYYGYQNPYGYGDPYGPVPNPFAPPGAPGYLRPPRRRETPRRFSEYQKPDDTYF